MSIRTILLVLLAAVSGMSAAVGVKRLREQPVAPTVEKVSIVVAADALPRGRRVTADVLKLRDYPRDLVPEGAITQLKGAVDRVASIPLAKDDPLVEAKLTAKGMGFGLDAFIPEGMRAFTITTSVVSGVAGFILPGSKVDVLLTVSNHGSDDPTGGGSTITLLQNVEILAVDQRVVAPADNKVDPKELRSVTLLVTPQQAASLDLGQNKGTLHLSLRHPRDTAPTSTVPATLKAIQFDQKKPWDERAMNLMAAFAKAMAQIPKEKEARRAVPSSEASSPFHVQTLKGTYESWVFLEAPRSATATRGRFDNLESQVHDLGKH
jgi:pilus assembly protein CpaB